MKTINPNYKAKMNELKEAFKSYSKVYRANNQSADSVEVSAEAKKISDIYNELWNITHDMKVSGDYNLFMNIENIDNALRTFINFSKAYSEQAEGVRIETNEYYNEGFGYKLALDRIMELEPKKQYGWWF